MTEHSQLLPERGRAPLRGTQSFVAVMGRVWRTPSLTGIEVLWRWIAGGGLVLWVWLHVGRSFYETAIATNSVSVSGSSAELANLHVWLPLACWIVVWTPAFGVGRKLLLRRLGAVRVRWGVLVGLTVLRLAVFSIVIALWAGVLGWLAVRIRWSGHIFSSNQNLVGAFALAVVVTLALFMFWQIVSWRFWLAMVIAAEEGCGVVEAFRRARREKAARAKLVEISLVMGIVKVALLVLAMTFTSCPLPFENVSTPQFMALWSTGVGVLWLLASDFFHVVRLASYVALYRATKS